VTSDGSGADLTGDGVDGAADDGTGVDETGVDGAADDGTGVDGTDTADSHDASVEDGVAGTGIDALALKPAETDLSSLAGTLDGTGVETVVVDYEGREHLPAADRLAALAERHEVLATTPVRADGFDPLGDDHLVDEWIPEGVGRALVAGHSAYLTETERERAVAPRFGAALRRAPDAWVGTEGVERIATATGAPQYELLSRSTDRDVRALRAAGFDGPVSLYAPVVVADDEDTLLDAVGDYAARRRPVREALPEDAATDATATGRARAVLSAAVRDYALVGTASEVHERVATLRSAGVTRVVGYPARGPGTLVE